MGSELFYQHQLGRGIAYVKGVGGKHMNLESFPETKREILRLLKRADTLSVSSLQSKLNITGQALRKHLTQLKEEGYVDRVSTKKRGPLGGRPTKEYYLTLDGDHLFPKNYDELTVELIDTVANDLGQDALLKILETMTSSRIKKWEPKLQGLDINDRVEALKGLYLQEDAFMEIERTEHAIHLIEHNCPFLSVATKRPALCSVTVSTLTQLLGYKVVRTEKFQDGDRKCVFHISLDQPIDKNAREFTLEE